MRTSILWRVVVAALLTSAFFVGCGSKDEAPVVEDGDTETTLDGDVELEPEVEEALEADSEEAEPSAFALTPSFLPTTKMGTALDFQIQAQGGTPPYTNFAIAKGDEAHGDKKDLPLGELPPGLTLDAATGKLAGTPTKEGFYFFVVQAEDAAGAKAGEVYGLRIGDPTAEGTMAARAETYQNIYEARHLWHGLSLDCAKPDDPDHKYELSTLGDSAFLSGQCTMAMAFRAGVLKTEAAIAITRQQAAGWRLFQAVTGVKGLIGRSLIHKDDPVEPTMWTEFASGSGVWRQGEGDYADYYWRTDTSRDQMTGAMIGNAALWAFVDDPEVKENAAAFLADVADHVWDHDLTIVDHDGEMTKYGDMSGERLEGWPAGNAQGAVCLLGWFKSAYVATGEERFKTYYDTLLNERDYLSILRDHEWTYAGYNTKFYNTYMSWENWYHLMRLEDDPTLRAAYKEILRDTLWLNIDDKTPNRRGIMEHNAVKTPWYLYSTGERDSEALWRVLWQLDGFPEAPLRDHAITNSADPTVVKNTKGPTNSETGEPLESLYALPYSKRASDMVVWHRSAYNLDSTDNSGRERTGCDYLLPYWMGRYYGYINSEW